MSGPFNPYESPKAPADPAEAYYDPKLLVGPGRRFINSLIDSFTSYIFTTVINIILILLYFGPLQKQPNSCGLFLFNLLLNFMYYLCFEYFLGKTPGKYITRTIVVNEQGLRPSFGQIMGRTAARYMPFEFISFFGKQSRGWHDTVSRTFVVSTKMADEIG